MATRINTRFVVGLLAVLGAIVLGIVGLYVLFVQRDVAELVRRGDAMMEAGEPARALDYYGPALRQQRTDLELIDKYVAAVKAAPVDDSLTAQTRLGQVRQWKQRSAELRPDEPRRLERFYAYEHRLARELGDAEAYNRLHTLTGNRLRAAPDDPIANKYHGIALMHRLTSAAPRERRAAALEALEAARPHFEDDAELLHHLARWHLFEAEQARRNDESERANELRERALALSQRMLDGAPEDIDRRIRHLHVLSRMPGDEARRAARSLVRELAQTLTERPEPTQAVLTVAEMLPRLERAAMRADEDGEEGGDEDEGELDAHGPAAGVHEARELVEAAAAAHGDDVSLLAALGRLRGLTGDRDAAIEAYEAVREKSRRGPPLSYLRDRAVRLTATTQLADLLLARADGADAGERREQSLERAAALIEELDQGPRQTSSPNPRRASELAMLRGKLALLRGRVGEAAVHLDRAVEQTQQPPPSLLLLSSNAHRRLGNWGTASDRLEALLERRPELSHVRVQLAELLLDGGHLVDAERHIRHLLTRHPRHAQPRQLLVRLLAQRGQIDAAVAQYERLDGESQSTLLRPLVQAHIATGRRDQAVHLLEARLMQNPADLRALHLLANLAPERVRSGDLLARASASGAQPLAVQLIERQLEQAASGADGDWLVELLDEQGEQHDQHAPDAQTGEDRTLERALLRVQLAQRQGDIAALRSAIERAASAEPDHNEVISLRFELALHDADWSLAERLAEQAGDRNLDQAHGAFFTARLAAARGELAEAAAHYRRALGTRTVYADGWRRFGDVLLRRDDLTEAIDAYRRALEQQPDNAAAHRGLAAALDQRGEHDAALAHLRQAVRHAPADEELVEQYARYEHRFGEPAHVLNVRRQLAHTHPHNTTNRRALAALVLTRGDRAAAAEHYQHLIDTRPLTAETEIDPATSAPIALLADLLTLVSLRLELEEPDAALALLEEHAALSDSHAALLARRARALVMTGRNDEAHRAFTRALAACRNPEQVTDVARQRAASEGLDATLAWLDERDALEGRDETERALPALWRQMAAASLEMQVGRSAAVIERLEPWRSMVEEADEAASPDEAFAAPVRWSFHRLLAQAHHHGGSAAQAAASYERMLRLRPEDLVTLNDLAYLLADSLGEAERALPLAERAAEMAPQNARVLDTLGWAQHLAGETEAARQTLQRALEIEAVPEAHLHLGVVHASLGEPDAAQAHFERARELAERTDNRAVLNAAADHLDPSQKTEPAAP